MWRVGFFTRVGVWSCTMLRMVNEHDKDQLDKGEPRKITANDVISTVCKLACLVICVMTFTTTILGQADLTYVVLGLSLAIILLTIALLQDTGKKR